MFIYIATRKGIANQFGDIVGQPDEKSQTRANPSGTFSGYPVMGFWRAVRQGIITTNQGKPLQLACGCCQRFPRVLIFRGNHEQ